LLPSGKFSRFALTVAAALTALLVLVVEGIRSPAASLLYSDLLQTAIVLWAAYCALRVALPSLGYLRRLWMLLAVALFMAAAAQAHLDIVEFSATSVKRAVAGSGAASKEQVGKMVAHVLHLARAPRPADVTDALALAIACAQRRGRRPP